MRLAAFLLTLVLGILIWVPLYALGMFLLPLVLPPSLQEPVSVFGITLLATLFYFAAVEELPRGLVIATLGRARTLTWAVCFGGLLAVIEAGLRLFVLKYPLPQLLGDAPAPIAFSVVASMLLWFVLQRRSAPMYAAAVIGVALAHGSYNHYAVPGAAWIGRVTGVDLLGTAALVAALGLVGVLVWRWGKGRELTC